MDKNGIYLGDAAEVLPTLDIHPKLIITSPPYDNLRKYDHLGFNFDSMADALVNVMDEGSVLVWIVADATIKGSETGSSFRQALGFMERGLKLHDTMIWQKPNPMPIENKGRYRSAWEYMFVFSKGKPSTINLIRDRKTKHPNTMSGGSLRQPDGSVRRFPSGKVAQKTTRHNIWMIPQPNSYMGHPAAFPYDLVRDHIRTWSNPGDLVLDPMAGSGTTLIAARDLGRCHIGIDVQETYVEIMCERLNEER